VPSLGRVKLGKFTDHRSPKVRRDVASALASTGISVPARGARRAPEDDVDLTVLRRAVRAHPVHGCSDREEHLQWARRWQRLTAENQALAEKVAKARGSLGQDLDRILQLLSERGYVLGDKLTPAGRTLSRIWSESDLVVAECLRRGLWEALDPAELAAVVSALVFESRRDSPGAGRTAQPRSTAAAEAMAATIRVWSEITSQERDFGLPATREPDLGFAAALSAWARGGSLTDAMTVAVAGGTDVTAGDFVRWCRQAVDLLDQVAVVAGGVVAETAGAAVNALRRGVVAMGSV
jgi:ATP-dependent RNA helicase HelY